MGKCSYWVWRVSDGKLLVTIRDGFMEALAWSPDGRFLALGGVNGYQRDVAVWRVQDGQLVATLTGHTDAVKSVAWSPDGKTLASGSGVRWVLFQYQPGDRTIRLWRVEDWQPLRTLRAHRDEIRSLVFSPDGQQLVSGSLDQTIRWWEMK